MPASQPYACMRACVLRFPFRPRTQKRDFFSPFPFFDKYICRHDSARLVSPSVRPSVVYYVRRYKKDVVTVVESRGGQKYFSALYFLRHRNFEILH